MYKVLTIIFQFFSCGTCCVTKHSQHPLTPYKQMTTPEEREIFVNNVMSVLRDASNSLQADFGESVRITPEYQNLKNVSFYFVGQFLIPFLEN